MREIAAASDFDFVALEPRRDEKASARKRSKTQKKSASARVTRFAALWRYRTPAFGVLILSGLLGAIAVNAMFLQHGRHPAPLFGSTVKIDPPKPPRPPARPTSIDALLNERIPSAPLQPVNPAQQAALSAPAFDESADSAPSPAPVAPTPAAKSSAVPHAAAPASRVLAAAPAKKPHDAIGALIAGNGVAAPAADRNVTAAQRALQKLGAPVKPDGDYGAATRKAVESFQRDNRLPATGELDAKTRRALSARSGVAVD